MDRLLSMRAFAGVVDAGSFSGAAARMKLNAAVVTRLIADLETHLDARLLDRTTRSLSLTAVGEDYLARCRQILADIDGAEALARGGQSVASGRVRIGAPVLFGLEILGPRLAAFRRKFPDITLDVLLLDRPFDLAGDGLDLAMTLARAAPTPTVVAQRLYDVQLILCAAPRYLKKAGRPTHPDDLAGHACLSLSNDLVRERWALERTGGERATVNIAAALCANNTELLRTAAREGLGIAVMVERSVRADLDVGTLVRVLPDWSLGRMTMSLLYPNRDLLPGRTRAVIDFVLEEKMRFEREHATRVQRR